MSNDTHGLVAVLAKLIGNKIIGVALSDDEQSAGITLSNGTVAWIDRDAEGNGSGWVKVEKM